MNTCVCCYLRVLGTGLFLLCSATLWAQAANPEPGRSLEPDRRITIRERDDWFLRGRRLAGDSWAALRRRAHLRKLQMRAARRPGAATGPAAAAAGTWKSLGPPPMASDASGFGQQDYSWVSGRATSVAID